MTFVFKHEHFLVVWYLHALLRQRRTRPTTRHHSPRDAPQIGIRMRNQTQQLAEAYDNCNRQKLSMNSRIKKQKLFIEHVLVTGNSRTVTVTARGARGDVAMWRCGCCGVVVWCSVQLCSRWTLHTPTHHHDKRQRRHNRSD